MPPEEFERPHLPPWLVPLSALGTVLRLNRKAETYETTIQLSAGGVIAITVPDNSEAAAQLARALREAGRILERNPARLRTQTDLFDGGDRGQD